MAQASNEVKADQKLILSRLLTDAERQFKLAIAVHAKCTASRSANAFDYFQCFSFGKHVADYQELSLTPDEEKRAAATLEHSATYLMAVQLDRVLQRSVQDRFKHIDTDVRSASWIVRLLRNAFAHDPLYPVWLIYPECDNIVFSVRDIITLDTTKLNGKPVRRTDYGGPLAVLRLSAFVRMEVLST